MHVREGRSITICTVLVRRLRRSGVCVVERVQLVIWVSDSNRKRVANRSENTLAINSWEYKVGKGVENKLRTNRCDNTFGKTKRRTPS